MLASNLSHIYAAAAFVFALLVFLKLLHPLQNTLLISSALDAGRRPRNATMHSTPTISNSNTSSSPPHPWFMAVSSSSPAQYKFFAKLALLSSKRHTALTCIVMLHGHDAEFEQWMCARGVHIFRVDSPAFRNRLRWLDPAQNTSILAFLQSSKTLTSTFGIATWLRLFIPDVLDEMLATGVIPKSVVDTEYVLYTDVDVLFTNKFDLPVAPPLVAAATQGDVECCVPPPHGTDFVKPYYINAGVVVVNVAAYRSICPEMIRFLVSMEGVGAASGASYNDQSLLRDFFTPKEVKSYAYYVGYFFYALVFHKRIFDTHFFRWGRGSRRSYHYRTLLPKEYEWEPYLGHNPASVIVHWHGPKPAYAKCGDVALNSSSFRLDDEYRKLGHHFLLSISGKASREGYIKYLEAYFYYYQLLCVGA